MKRSQLRKIIRESIKEQVGSSNGAYVVLNTCECDQTTGVGCANPTAAGGAYGVAYSSSTICMTVDGGQIPQVGQLVDIPGMTGGNFAGSQGPMVEHVFPNHPACQPGGSGNPPYDWPTLGSCHGTGRPGMCYDANGVLGMEVLVQATTNCSSQGGTYPCVTIDGQTPTQADIGKLIYNNTSNCIQTSAHPSLCAAEIYQVNPTQPAYAGAAAEASSTPTCYESWDCEQIGDHPKFGSKCTKVVGFQGQFPTMQDCIASGCEGIGPDKGDDIQQPFSPSPLTTTPQPKISEPDDELGTIEPEDEDEEEILRLQELANIR